MTEAVIIQKLVHWFADWFLYDNGLRHERVKGIHIKPWLHFSLWLGNTKLQKKRITFLFSKLARKIF